MPRCTLAAAAFVGCEWLRGWLFTGFPWLNLGVSQAPLSPLAGLAPYLGAYGVSLAVSGAAALLAIIGLVNLPIIYFSVKWWNTLHQGATVKFTGTSMHATMFTGMMLMTLACWMYSIGTALVRVRAVILDRERRTQWVRAL